MSGCSTFEEKKHIRTICLPVNESQQIDLKADNQTLIVAGWGQTDTSLVMQDELLKTSVPYLPNEQCNEKYASLKIANPIKISDNQMCAGGSDQRDSCNGDSGAPLIGFADLDDVSRMFQYGIVSFGKKCETQTVFPAVYTRISKYLGWILDNITED